MKSRLHNATSSSYLDAILGLFASIAAFLLASSPACAAPLDAEAIGKAAGSKATITEDGIVRIAWSRTDVPVMIDGMSFPPAAGLGSWAAFAQAHDGSMVMGDTVVFEDEVDAAMDAAFAQGLEVTALHNHFFFDKPKVYFMHIGGMGPAEELAAGVRAVWDAIKGVRAENKEIAKGFAGTPGTSGPLDAQALSRIVGHSAPVSGGVAKITIGREGRMHGVAVGASMGLTTWAAFFGSDANAVMDGDFIMTVDEVQPVLRALRKAGVHIVALHQHMTGEEPTFYFTHFWGKGNAAELARGFKAALDAQAMTSKR